MASRQRTEVVVPDAGNMEAANAGLGSLPPEVMCQIGSMLNARCCRGLGCVNRRHREIILENERLRLEVVRIGFNAKFGTKIRIDEGDMIDDEDWYPINDWPIGMESDSGLKVDERNNNLVIQYKDLNSHRRNRCARGNYEFSLNSHGLLPTRRRDGRRVWRRTNLAYFEVQIIQGESAPPPQGVPPACAVVGISSDNFALRPKMPGWDRNSIAYHGDDGHLFHGSGRGSTFHRPYGIGDTVGCGLIQDGETTYLFFTLNGELFHQTKIISIRNHFMPRLYPVVALDHPSLALEINFGFNDSHFLFDDPILNPSFRSYSYFLRTGSRTVSPERYFYATLHPDRHTHRRQRSRFTQDSFPFITDPTVSDDSDEDSLLFLDFF